MRVSLSVIALSVLSVASSAATYPDPINVTGGQDVHDPTICKDSSGKYFLFFNGTNIPIRTSTDRINWSDAGTVWAPGQPTWTYPYIEANDSHLWAPDLRFLAGTRMSRKLYYSASTINQQNSALFLAKSFTGLPGSWDHQGLIISSNDNGTYDYNAIDPNLFIDGDKWWLAFGSYWSGVKLTGKISGSTLYSLATRTVNEVIEAPTIVKQDQYYYLFTSWGQCCQGTDSTYHIRVGRATSLTGPYVDQDGVQLTSNGGTTILTAHGSVYGPGGQDIFEDTDSWVINYHYYAPKRQLGINRLNFSSGWPVVY
ncbi:unnamed protein product [Rhizoctonia solani]|uniref:arabinan endo-1,5-alpha-L-arabinosidase n=1 Tax=Rhizoctonia solani TaxID=456999 RepID=A0A8H2W8I3_9AGAM|nr:unnamed protein product [Rhizoctonia solani]